MNLPNFENRQNDQNKIFIDNKKQPESIYLRKA